MSLATDLASPVSCPALGARRIGLPTILVVVLAVAGFVLRIMAARGDLWLDEIWSLQLVAGISRPDEVFWKIAHDNNHVLNSLWLFAIGPDRSPIIVRLPAILFGTASILVSGRIGFRRNAASGVAFAAMVALGYPFLTYGSEARGYAGLILATLLAIDIVESELSESSAVPTSDWRLSAAMLFGTLSHLTMLTVFPLLGVTVLLRRRQSGMGWLPSVMAAVDFLRRPLLAVLPFLAVMAVGVAHKGGMTMGNLVPFSPENFAEGLGRLAGLMLGMPYALPGWAGLMIVAAVLLFSARLLDPAQRTLMIGMLVIPSLMLLARLPNTEQPRYFLVPGVVAVLLVTAVFGACWGRGGVLRVIATGALVLILTGHLALDATLLRFGRGSLDGAVAMITAGGEARYATNAEFRTAAVMDYETRSGPVHLKPVSLSDAPAFCPDPPVWLIGDRDPSSTPIGNSVTVGPSACRIRYGKVADFPTTRLSGIEWTLFERD